jgi:GAF domain-containing protein
MPMRATTVRFSDDLWRLLEEEARREGVSSAQFVRDATIMRVAHSRGRRGEPMMGSETPAGAADQDPARLIEAAGRAAADPERLAALEATGLAGTGAEEGFDRVARMAAEILNAPVALVSLVDADRQHFKSCLGLPEPWQSRRGTPLSHSFCQHAVAAREALVVDDAREHPVLKTNLAIKDLGVIAYAGVPLIDSSQQALGTLCVIDSRPRRWTTNQLRLLEDLAASVVSEIELRRASL